ncbi:hypothetical protein BELL_0047g00160 [Botrytis elliptica]|uniref:Uncharacterized protein n=1 Tax=Botrytis elliptica TaxID=278938 RepID=A0A4Z1KCR0_9HELO|nr:hypothetical protein BELL_0047g00160 [Botrytis elliptica]
MRLTTILQNDFSFFQWKIRLEHDSSTPFPAKMVLRRTTLGNPNIRLFDLKSSLSSSVAQDI